MSGSRAWPQLPACAEAALPAAPREGGREAAHPALAARGEPLVPAVRSCPHPESHCRLTSTSHCPLTSTSRSHPCPASRLCSHPCLPPCVHVPHPAAHSCPHPASRSHPCRAPAGPCNRIPPPAARSHPHPTSPCPLAAASRIPPPQSGAEQDEGRTTQPTHVGTRSSGSPRATTFPQPHSPCPLHQPCRSRRAKPASPGPQGGDACPRCSERGHLVSHRRRCGLGFSLPRHGAGQALPCPQAPARLPRVPTSQRALGAPSARGTLVSPSTAGLQRHLTASKPGCPQATSEGRDDGWRWIQGMGHTETTMSRTIYGMEPKRWPRPLP